MYFYNFSFNSIVRNDVKLVCGAVRCGAVLSVAVTVTRTHNLLAQPPMFNRYMSSSGEISARARGGRSVLEIEGVLVLELERVYWCSSSRGEIGATIKAPFHHPTTQIPTIATQTCQRQLHCPTKKECSRHETGLYESR